MAPYVIPDEAFTPAVRVIITPPLEEVADDVSVAISEELIEKEVSLSTPHELVDQHVSEAVPEEVVVDETAPKRSWFDCLKVIFPPKIHF